MVWVHYPTLGQLLLAVEEELLDSLCPGPVGQGLMQQGYLAKAITRR